MNTDFVCWEFCRNWWIKESVDYFKSICVISAIWASELQNPNSPLRATELVDEFKD